MLAGAELLATLLCAICPALPAAGMSRARGGGAGGEQRASVDLGPGSAVCSPAPTPGTQFWSGRRVPALPPQVWEPLTAHVRCSRAARRSCDGACFGPRMPELRIRRVRGIPGAALEPCSSKRCVPRTSREGRSAEPLHCVMRGRKGLTSGRFPRSWCSW